MASEDAPLVADPVEPDVVSAEMHAASSARRDAKAVETTFLRSWSEAHKALFHNFVADQEALFKELSLSALNEKVARQSQLVAKHMVDQCYVMSDGKLSVSAALHATLSALRKCQSAATVKEHAAKEDKLDNRSKGWLEVARNNQAEATHGMANGNAKKQPAAGGVYAQSVLPPGRGNSKTRGQQQLAVANGKAALPLQPSRAGAGFADSVDQYQGSRRNFRSPGGPPGLKPDQRNPDTFASFTCRDGRSGGGGLSSVPFGSHKPEGGAAAGAGRAKGAAAASQPSQQRTTRHSKQKKCQGCGNTFLAEEVSRSSSLNMDVCRSCERTLHNTNPEAEKSKEQTAFLKAMEKAQRPQPKPKKCTETLHISLLSDSEADADGEDKPLAETARKRPVRAAAVAAQSLSQQLAGLKALYPSSGDTHAVEVSAADLFHLQPSEFLNDTVIDLYLKKLERELLEPTSKRVHFFNTFFYKKLAQKHTKTEGAGDGSTGDGFKPGERAAHDRVKKWTKHVDIFSKDFVFVPVHSGLHWSLAIICHPGVLQPPSDHEVIDIDDEPGSNPAHAAIPVTASPVTQEDVQAAALCAPDDSVVDMDVDVASIPVAAEELTAPPSAAEPPPAVPPLKAPFILHLDSMSGGHSPSLISGKLRPYLAMEWERLALSNPESVPALSGLRTRSFAQDKLTVKKLTLPQQNNSSDCGCFLLTYLEHFLKCMPDYLSYEQLKGLEKGKGIKLPDCADFLGEHWFDPVRGFNMRERVTNVILDLFVAQAGEPQDDDARNRLQHAKNALEAGRADEARAAEAAAAKELKYAEKLQRRAEKLAAGPAAPGAAVSDSESELPVVLMSKSTRSKKKATGDAAVTAADAADDEGGEQRNSGRPRRASRAAVAVDGEYERAPAPSDSEFQPDKPEREKREKPGKAAKRRRPYLSRDTYDDEEQEALEGVVRPSTRAKARSDAKAGAASPADAIDVDADDEGAPGFAPITKSPDIDFGAPGFPPEPLASAGARGSSPPPAAAAAAPQWGVPVPLLSPLPPASTSDYFAMVPSQPPPQQPLKPPPPVKTFRRRGSDKAASEAVEQPAAPAQEVITVDDDNDDAENPNGTQSL